MSEEKDGVPCAPRESILEGIRVVDVTQFIAGSRATQLLADMGAEVVKVEPPQGDTLRLIFSLLAGAERNYSVFNRNKYGICVDWRTPRGQEVMHRLAAGADIFVHNLIPGTLERHRLGYETLRYLNPGIIYIAISGFGATGINPERAAFDIIAQATAGQFWNDTETLSPPSNHWGDLMSGAYAALAACLAPIHRLRTGQGQFIDISMQDVLYFNNYRAIINRAMEPIMGRVQEVLGRRPDDVLNSQDRMPFYGFFQARDGKVAIVALTPRQWKDLAHITGHGELLEDARFANLVSQIHHHAEAVSLIEEWTTRHDAHAIVALLEKKKIPCGIAYTVDQVNRDENLEARGMFAQVEHPAFGTIDVPGIPFKFALTPGAITQAAPLLGEHTRTVLSDWLGYSPAEIAALYDDTIVK